MLILRSNSPVRRAIAQFFRYMVVGGIAFIVDFGVFYLLLSVAGLHYLVAATLAYLAGLFANYQLAIAWVFDNRRISHRGYEFVAFALIGLIGLGLTVVLIDFLSIFFHGNYLQSKLLAALLILVFNFGARKLLLFTSHREYSRNC